MKLFLFGSLRIEVGGQIRPLMGINAALLGQLGLQSQSGYTLERDSAALAEMGITLLTRRSVAVQ